MFICIFLAALSAATIARAEQIDVMIGEGGNNVFKPDSVTAREGDVLRFQWAGGQHNVVSSDYDRSIGLAQPSGLQARANTEQGPCQPNDLIASPTMMGGSDGAMDFFVMVNSTDPLYMYCSVADHCNDGMVMVVNAPDSGEDLDSYREASAKANKEDPENTPAGGIVAAASATPFTSMMDGSDGGNNSNSSMSSGGSGGTMAGGGAMDSEGGNAANALKVGGLGLFAAIAGAALIL